MVVDSWGAHAAFLIPIIPEKNKNKTGALGLSGYAWTLQKAGYFQPPWVESYYWRSTGNAATNVASQFGGQL